MYMFLRYVNCSYYPFISIQKLEELHAAVEGSRSVCVLVQGPGGSGKTSLLREYAEICGYSDEESLVVVHLGEQIDSKVSYLCIVYAVAVNTCIYFQGHSVTFPFTGGFKNQL